MRAAALLLVLCSSAFAHADAPPGKVFRVGTLTAGTLESRTTAWDAFRQRLRDLGYVEGRNLVLEHRSQERETDSLPRLAADLARARVDVIVALGSEATLSAKRATSEVPIVMTGVADAETAGLVASLARPGANVTGVTLRSTEVAAKRVELLKELAPGASRIAILLHEGAPLSVREAMLEKTRAGARALRMQAVLLTVRSVVDIEPAFKTAVAEGAQGLLVLDSPFTVTHRTRIAGSQ